MTSHGGRYAADRRHDLSAAGPASGADSPPRSSGAATPTSTSAGSSSFLSSSLYGAFGGLMRRLSSEPSGHLPHHGGGGDDDHRSIHHASTYAAPDPLHGGSGGSHPSLLPSASYGASTNNGVNGVYTPPFARTASPLRPPPLEPLTLSGFDQDTPASARLLTASVAEEIRIMVPERLRIEDDWRLVYSLDQDGASLATLYEKAAAYNEHRIGFVLVVKDQEGGIFGAYLTDCPHPSPHYFGTGECFLWRASVLAPLPPPPSADTTHLSARSTTIAASPTRLPSADGAAATASASLPNSSAVSPPPPSDSEPLIPGLEPAAAARSPPQPPPQPPQPPPSPSIRFSAFPYSGVNEYFIYCEPHSLSVGGGDGKYGLWLDDSLEKGISATCLTFGNQPLSDEGDRFGVLGVEVWVIGSRR